MPSLRRALVVRLLLAVFLTMTFSVVVLLLEFRTGITGMDDQTIDIQVEVLRGSVRQHSRRATTVAAGGISRDVWNTGHAERLSTVRRGRFAAGCGGFAPSFVPLPAHDTGSKVTMQREQDAKTDNNVLTATLAVERPASSTGCA